MRNFYKAVISLAIFFSPILIVILLNWQSYFVNWKQRVNQHQHTVFREIFLQPTTEYYFNSGDDWFKDENGYYRREITSHHVGNDIYQNIYSIEFSGDKNTWEKLYTGKDLNCHLLFSFKSVAHCLSRSGNNFVITKIEHGKIIEKEIHSSLLDSSQLLKLKLVGTDLYFVWNDERARRPYWYSYIPVAQTINPYYGPYLIMGGKLNLDTMEFEEYVLKYDSYDFP